MRKQQKSLSLKNRITRFFLRSPSKYIFWISLAMFFKALIPFLQLFLGHRADSHLLSFGFIGDGPSYTDPIEHLVATGHYSPDFRMPGYGAIYYLFRCMMSYNAAYNCMIILQLILASLSVYFTALLARLVLKSKRAFFVCFYLFLISTYSNYYDICIMSECACSAFLVFATWFFALYLHKHKLKYMLFSGIFLAWVVFLRPVFLPVFGLFGFIYLIYAFKNKIGFIKPLLILAIPFVIADGAWITRNYSVHKKIMPLTNSILYPYIDSSYMKNELQFVQSWGGAKEITDRTTAMSWFGGLLFPGEPELKNYHSVPDYVYTSAFNRDSLLRLKSKVHQLMAIQLPSLDSMFAKNNKDWNKVFPIFYYGLRPVSPQAAALQTDIENTFDKYTTSVKKEHKFLYYVKVPIILTKGFIYGDYMKVYFKRGNIGKLGPWIERFFNLFYLAMVFLGLAGAVLLLFKGFKSKSHQEWLLALIPIYTILIHTCIIRMCAENRLFMPAWPFVLACAAYTIVAAKNLVKQKG